MRCAVGSGARTSSQPQKTSPAITPIFITITVQSTLMVIKIGVIAGLVFCGWLLVRAPEPTAHRMLDRAVSFDLWTAVGAAMVPVVFAYGGWQTANFIAGEVREPRRNLPRGLLIGVCSVVALYLAVNFVCVRAL